MQGEGIERLERLRGLIADTAVTPVFQPIVDLRRAQVAGHESLTRPAPNYGFECATDLFSAAEECGLTWELERVTRSAAFGASACWPSAHLLFINVSPRVFIDPRFPEEMAASVRATAGLSPDRVVLEITEQAGDDDVGAMSAQVELVKSHGFQIAIDDVGAGASGLNRIMAMRPQWLKLNRALVDRVDQDRVMQNMVRFLLHFARLSGVRLIAEGIEREEELATLIDLGVPYGQGYLLGKPSELPGDLDASRATAIRKACGRADSERFRSPRTVTIGRFARPARSVPSTKVTSDAASELLKDLMCEGMAVVDGDRFLGWCDREQVLRAARDRRAREPIGYLASPDTLVVSPDTPVANALEMAAGCSDRAAGSPMVLWADGAVAGVLTVRDLMRAAAEVCGEVQVRTSPLTGLPGRVRCDEHVQGEIARSAFAGHASDAAVIDIRHLTDYNGAYGYELGDELIRRLAAMIRVHVQREESAVFLGHLSDDRFLVTGPSGVLPSRLRRLTAAFDRAAGIFLAAADSDRGPSQGADLRALLGRCDNVGLRVVYLAEAFHDAADPREIFQTVDRLRAAAPEPERGVSRCVIIAGEAPVKRQRKSA